MEVLSRVLGAAAIIAVFLGIYAWWRRGRSKAGRSWRALAARIGGKVTHDNEGFFFDPSYQLHCALDGYRVRLEYYRGAGRHAPTYTRASILVPGEFELWIQRQGVVQSVLKMVGGQDFEIGDPEYDEVFVIKSSDGERARKQMSPELIRLHLDSPKASIVVDEHGCMAEVEGLVTDHERCLDLMDLVVATARAFASTQKAAAS